MLHEQLFPAANRITGYIIPEVALDRLSRYGNNFLYGHIIGRISFHETVTICIEDQI